MNEEKKENLEIDAFQDPDDAYKWASDEFTALVKS